MKISEETAKDVAERIVKASRARDFALVRALQATYRAGTPERNQIDALCREIAEEYRKANPCL